MEYGKAFSFPFKDKEWLTKAVVGGVFVLLSCILVGIPFLLGYLLELIRNVAAGRDEELPNWGNLGEKFKEGLILALIGAVLAIPFALFGCITSFFTNMAASGNSDAAAAVVTLVSLMVGLLSFLWGIIYALVLPAVMIRYAMTRDIGGSIRPREVWGTIRASVGQYVLILIVAGIASSIASFGVILCVIGVFLTYFWAALVEAHLLGQYQRNFLQPGGNLPPAYTPAQPL
jgi:hypothetical protein